MDGSEAVPTVAIPYGGPRNITPDVGRVMMLQIEMFTVRTATEINRLGDERDRLLAAMGPEQRSVCHAIALAIANFSDC